MRHLRAVGDAVTTLRAPFPWFGGKSRAASLVWEAFGDVVNYVEPFAGSLAVLLGRPTEPRIETINDLDCYVANFWRAVANAPDEVAHFCDWPVNEADLSARHQWLVDSVEFRARMAVDPEYFDARRAGWWCWGACAWIGSGWCQLPESANAKIRGLSTTARPHLSNAGQGVNRQLPHLGDGGKGETVSSLTSATAGDGDDRQLPHAGNAGRGVHRKLPHAGDAGRGVRTHGSKMPDIGGRGEGQEHTMRGIFSERAESGGVYDWMRSIAARLRRVRVACGDWSRVCTPSVTHRHGLTGVLLDPPYGEGAVDYAAGGNASTSIADDVRAWAISEGDNPLMRIALCGYDGQHDMPPTWRVVEWKAHGGYGGGRGTEAEANAYRERIWLSPFCFGKRQPSLFDDRRTA